MDSTLATSGSPSAANTSKKKGKKRIRVFTQSDRAEHRAIEKQRREALNERFVELARQLPALAPVRRLCKSMIVNESITYHQAQRASRLAAAAEIRTLLAERDELLAEINDWRGRFGPSHMEQRRSRPINGPVLDLLNVEQEKFGNFPEGFGDNGFSERRDDDQSVESENRPIADWDSNQQSPQLPIGTTIPSGTDPSALMGEVDFGQSLNETLHTPVDFLPVDGLYSTTMPQGTIENVGDMGAVHMPKTQQYSDEELLAYLVNEHSSSLAPYSEMHPSPDLPNFHSPQSLFNVSSIPSAGLQHFVPFVETPSYDYIP